MTLKDVQTSMTEYHDAHPHEAIRKIKILPAPEGWSVKCEWVEQVRTGRGGVKTVDHGIMQYGDLNAFYRWLATTDYAGVMGRRRRRK